ncbi:hypothetical protein HZ996_02975 [Cryomorphaceae bacterium]|nr:hypothetical protein HZ996_02975 [Cryomorphaceae bacterium]
MSDQEFDKRFEDAAGEQDFLFSMSSWEEAEAMLDRNDPTRVDAAVANAASSFEVGEATTAGFEAAMGQYSALKARRRRRKAVVYWSAAAGVLALLTIGAVNWFDTADALEETPIPAVEQAAEETTAPTTDSEQEEAPATFELDDASGSLTGTSTSEGSVTETSADLGSVTDQENSNSRVIEGMASGSIDGSGTPPVAAESMGAEAQSDASHMAAAPVEKGETESDDRALATKVDLEKLNASTFNVALVDAGPQGSGAAPSDFVLPPEKKGVGPEGEHDWALIAAGRSMRLADVPDGFDITNYSPEFGLRYAHHLDDRFSWEAELTGYLIAGTQGSVTFARTVYGMGAATQVRYIKADQSVQLEMPVRVRYRFANRHFMTCGFGVTYMLPTQVQVSEELHEWYDVESLGSYETYGYVHGMRRWNVSWSAGYQWRISDRLALNTAVNYYLLDRDLLDSEALAPVPWQVRVGVHYSLFR